MTKVKWFIPERELTIEQEFFCWRVAYHGVYMKAVREAYGTKGPGAQNTKGWKNMQKPKILARVKELLKMHKASEINLTAGPWMHYNTRHVGQPIDPGNSISYIKRKHRYGEGDEC